MEKNRLTSANWIYYEQIYRCEFIEQIHELYFMNKFIVIYYYKKKRRKLNVNPKFNLEKYL